MTVSTTTSSRVALLREIIRAARNVFDGTMADVTPEQAHYIPPGIANPLGATYAHVVVSEDLVVQGMFKQGAPLFASSWAGRTGLSEAMPMPGPEWSKYAGWTRSVKVDLPALRAYAQAVADATDEWLASLSESDLDQPMDLTGFGLGQHTWGTAIPLLIANHLGTETGEIAVLKGLQGARGYPN
ncbi:MAG TPA: DinB family protein [Chloroflexota bacterium]|jgi:hypothetical protein|nr:DinB family protein [Chloroflexota bacterium]